MGSSKKKAVGTPDAASILKLCAKLVLFGVHTVDSVLADSLLAALPRDLDVVELWSGVGTVVAAAKALGCSAVPFDKDRIPGKTQQTEDITSLTGFQLATSYVMRLRVGGLLHMAPVCSSFVFANSSNCLRSGPDFEGNLLYDAVIAGNLMATISGFFMLLAHCRGVHASAENPSSSMYFSYKPMVDVFDALGVSYYTTDGCRFSTQKKGERFLKRFKFAALGQWISRVHRRCKCPGGLHKELMIKNENGGTSGTPELKMSQAYPKALGAAIVSAWHKQQEAEADDWTRPEKPHNCKQDVAAKKSRVKLDWTKPSPSERSETKKPARRTIGKQKVAAKKSRANLDWTKPSSSEKSMTKKPAKRTIGKQAGTEWCKVSA